MKVLGHVQRFGVGIQTAQGEMSDNGNPPITFRVDQSFVVCIAYPAPGVRGAAEQVTEQVTEQVERLLKTLGTDVQGTNQLMHRLGLAHRPTFIYDYLQPAMRAGLIEMTIPEKPRSSKQKYRITEKGRRLLGEQR